ncbi:MAG: WYL domain-containing protein [Rhodocyclaceae bacterium]|nr:WYL domain-containing protein [Rhodocyclaceae bacterium]
MLQCEIPQSLNRPEVHILAPVTQAINRQKGVRITYHSFSSGRSEREIVPFALADNGLRWHVRAYCRSRQEFRDFVLTRIESSELLDDSSPEEHERASNDIQWSRIVELELVPHPGKRDHDVIALDYGMPPQEKVLRVRARAALAGYFLRQWSVDCSEKHCLTGPEVRLWLRNPLALYGISSASLAPGYGATRNLPSYLG